jgi:SAM-dependent methyltransferase
MREPYLSHFRSLIRAGASVQDIHDVGKGVGYAAGSVAVSAEYVEREVGRVGSHQASLCPLLERYVGRARRVLDVGCNTGGTTLAVALSPVLNPEKVVGVDPNATAVHAASVRARGYELAEERVSFLRIEPGRPLPFEGASFDLTMCVSVLEFVTTLAARVELVREMRRVTAPGGYVYLATPSPYHLRELHTRRVLGDFFRRDGYPWACTPGQLKAMFNGCELVRLHGYLAEKLVRKIKLPAAAVPGGLARCVTPLLRWQKLLARVPAGNGVSAP